jgi:predicted transcriptional regulator
MDVNQITIMIAVGNIIFTGVLSYLNYRDRKSVKKDDVLEELKAEQALLKSNINVLIERIANDKAFIERLDSKLDAIMEKI